jgi:surface antigen
MAGPVACFASRQLPPYSGTASARHRRWQALVAAIALGFMAGGCSMSGHLESMFSKSDSKAPADVTGSIPAKPAPAMTASGLPPESDLVYTRAAVAELLTQGGKDTSRPWENPRSGARGTVTPIATAYSQAGLTCRDFLASYVRSGSEAWMQGEACRAQEGKWEVKSLRPWKRS